MNLEFLPFVCDVLYEGLNLSLHKELKCWLSRLNMFYWKLLYIIISQTNSLDAIPRFYLFVYFHLSRVVVCLAEHKCSFPAAPHTLTQWPVSVTWHYCSISLKSVDIIYVYNVQISFNSLKMTGREKNNLLFIQTNSRLKLYTI